MAEADKQRREDSSQRLSTLIAVGMLGAAFAAFAIRYHFAHPTEDRELARATNSLVERLRKAHPAWAEEVAKASQNGACAGAERAAARGLDADLGDGVSALLDRLPRSCPKLSSLAGLRAEAAARAGLSDANFDASQVLTTRPADPYALYARGLLGWRAHDPAAMSFAERAREAGRGPSADLLLGLIAYDAGKLDVAARSFQVALAQEPLDVAALYDLALVEQRLGHYLRAREGYLAVLRAQPDHPDARFNLGILAHSIGANAEAQHHLAKLRASSRDAGKVAELERALATPPPSAALARSPHYSVSMGAVAPRPDRPAMESQRSPAP